MIAERQLFRVRPVLRHGNGVVAQHGIFQMLQDIGPGIEFDVMRVHVHDEIIVQVQAGDIAMRVGEDFARVSARRDLLHLVFACAAHSVDDFDFAHSHTSLTSRRNYTASRILNGLWCRS